MSEGHRIYVSNDETQIMIDVNSGKYYSLLSNHQHSDNRNQRNQSLNFDRSRDVNLIPLIGSHPNIHDFRDFTNLQEFRAKTEDFIFFALRAMKIDF
jgi:hypothetical protein